MLTASVTEFFASIGACLEARPADEDVLDSALAVITDPADGALTERIARARGGRRGLPARPRPDPRRAARLARLARGLAARPPAAGHLRPPRRDLRLHPRAPPPRPSFRVWARSVATAGPDDVVPVGAGQPHRPPSRHLRTGLDPGRRRPHATAARRPHPRLPDLPPPPGRPRCPPSCTASPAGAPPTRGASSPSGSSCSPASARSPVTVGQPLSSRVSIPGTSFEKVLDRLGAEIPEAAGGVRQRRARERRRRVHRRPARGRRGRLRDLGAGAARHAASSTPSRRRTSSTPPPSSSPPPGRSSTTARRKLDEGRAQLLGRGPSSSSPAAGPARPARRGQPRRPVDPRRCAPSSSEGTAKLESGRAELAKAEAELTAGRAQYQDGTGRAARDRRAPGWSARTAGYAVARCASTRTPSPCRPADRALIPERGHRRPRGRRRHARTTASRSPRRPCSSAPARSSA